MTAITRKPFRKSPLALAAMLVAGVAPTHDALATSCTWNPSSGNWGSAGNWSCGIVPSGPPQDSATIGSGKTVTVNNSAGQSIYTLVNAGSINIDAFTLTLQGGGSTVNSGTINIGTASVTAALQDFNNITNTGGVINIATGSVLNQFGTTITGGTIAGAGTLVATNTSANILSGVTLNSTLDLATGIGIERVIGGMTLNGAVNVNNNSVLNFEGTQSLGGSGTITLGNTGGSNRIGIDNTGVLTIGSGILIHGQNGTIGGQPFSGGASTLNNGGTISADVSGGSINIVTNQLNNTGALSAAGGGQLMLSGAVANTGGGHIDATGAGSNVFQNGVSITGGAINTSSGGVFIASNNGGNFLSAAALNGTIDIATNTGIERVTSGLTLTSGSRVNVNSNSVLTFEGTQTIGGNGTITLGDTGGGNRIGIDGGATLTVGSGVLIHGQNGTIGGQPFIGGASLLINNGTIAADVAGGTITLATTSGAANSVTNNGLLQAINGGTLVLNSNVTGSAGSSINVGAGSTVLQNGVTLSSVISNPGSGSFVASNNGGNYFNGVAFNGTLDLASNTAIERVVNGLALNGAINVNNNSILTFEGTQALSGNGTITLGDTGGGNRIGIDGGATLTVGSGVLIHGQNGTIGGQPFIGGASLLINNGTIAADVAGGTITLATTSGAANSVTNNGLLQAINGGTLVLNSNVTGSAGSSINVGAGSTVLQNGVTLSSVISNPGSGSFVASNNGGNYFNGVAFNGTLDLASNTAIERVVNGLALNGAINVNNNSVLTFEGTQALTGSGTITLGDTGGGNRIGIDNTGTLNVGSGILIHGQNGTIGGQPYIGGASTLNNGGTILADVTGGVITVSATQTNNTATLSAGNGGQLVLNGTVTNTGGGHIDATGAGSNVYQNGITITGGAINSSAGGVFIASNSGGNYLSGVTLNGTLDATNTSIERVVDGMVLNGAIKINNNTVLNFEGVQSLSGSGTITLGDTGGSNRIGIDNTGTLNVGSGILIHGQNGTIGGQPYSGGAATLNNSGTISADVTGGLVTIAATNVTNNGTLGAQNGGTLTVQPTINGTGTLRVDTSGTMNLANGGNTQGKLTMGAAGAINIGTGNLTITNDYTNAQSGSGNAFDRRASVSGTGLIVAGGDAKQVITGAGVTGGATTNATLTLGNVHVGTTTYNYQVANTGTTGPSLRGAIQTNVNGASLTDARLSGSGVTAGNYNTGAPGSNTGNLAVTFTAANAGALSPLSGQALNLTSNFSNIADQKLNIVLGSGAAAYNLANGSATSPVVIANQRIGGSGSATVTVANVAAAGSFSEDLNASVTGTGGMATGSGAVTGRLAGTSNTGSGAITVGVNTASAGAKTGTVNLGYVSTGTVNGVSNGLGTSTVGTQAVTINGNVYQAATGALQSAALNFGTVQVGQSVSQSLVIRNTATGAAGFVEDLNASFGSASGTGASLITGSGSLSGILAGTNSTAGNGTMTVSVNTSAAGTVAGGIAVNYTTAGAVAGVSNGLGTASAGSQSFGVAGTINATANVINQASPLVNTPTITLASRRVGDAAATANVSITNVATSSPQAALNASISSNGAPVTASGAVTLAPGSTSSNQLSVGLGTTTAGNFTGVNAGSATIALVSDASNVGNCAPNCQLTLASQQVSVSGKVYTAASAQVNTPSVNFGIVHTGDVVATRGVSVTNSAGLSGLNDVLVGSIGTSSAGFTATGNLAGLAAQTASPGSFQVGLSTATSGMFSGTATTTFASHNADMTDLALASSPVALSGQVNNYAQASLNKVTGTAAFSQSASNTYTLDFGTLLLGSAGLTDTLSILNSASGLADLLAGSFVTSGVGAEFALGGFGSFSGLAAGYSQGGLTVTFQSGLLGSFNDTIVLHSAGSNASGYNVALNDTTLFLRGNVVSVTPVPEPATNALMLVGLMSLIGVARARRARAARDAA